VNKQIKLKQKEENRLRSGHLWVFSNEIAEICGGPDSGDIVEVLDSKGFFIGLGFYNKQSLIAARLLTREKENIGSDFWKRRINEALLYRKKVLPNVDSFRAVFGESDLLPGLIVDKYGEYLSCQFISAGIDKNRKEIIDVLVEIFSPKGVILRNDSSLRKMEGLEEKVEVVYGELPEYFLVEENVLKFKTSLQGGQKTGYFFDQRDNRASISGYCEGKKVLDCFSYIGTFGMNAAKGKAKEVTFVDSSQSALELAKENTGLNSLGSKFEFIKTDAADYLEQGTKTNSKFDIIILDPPALIKSKKDFFKGFKAYVKLNLNAFRLLERGGILATSSCSHNLGYNDFLEMLRQAQARSGKYVRLIETGTQAKDHPILVSMPETEYLKFAILEVM
jgi:23S rRNA (cytosine1962-C5)-methyltransferase